MADKYEFQKTSVRQDWYYVYLRGPGISFSNYLGLYCTDQDHPAPIKPPEWEQFLKDGLDELAKFILAGENHET